MNPKPTLDRAQLYPIPVKSPIFHVGVYFAGPIPPTTENGNRFLLTMTDYFTKYGWARPYLQNKQSMWFNPRDAAVRQIHGPERSVNEFFRAVRIGPDRTLKTLDRSVPVWNDLISECTLKHSIRMIFVDSFPKNIHSLLVMLFGYKYTSV